MLVFALGLVGIALPYGGYLKPILLAFAFLGVCFKLYLSKGFQTTLENFEDSLDACRMDAEGRETYKVQMKDRIDGEIQRVGRAPVYAKFYFNGEQCDLFAVVRKISKYHGRNHAREQQKSVK